MPVLKRIRKQAKNFFTSPDAVQIEKIISQQFIFLNKIFKFKKNIHFNLTNTTLFTDQRPLKIQFTQNIKFELFKKSCHFKPNLEQDSNALGTITISTNILKQEIPYNSKDFLIELYGKRNKQFSHNITTEQKQQIILKYLIYHELAHAYQHNLYMQNKNILNTNTNINTNYNTTGSIVGHTDYYHLSCYNLTKEQENNTNIRTTHYLSLLSQEMYADIFALTLLAQDYGFNNIIVDDMFNIIQYVRQDNSGKDPQYYYPVHTTEKALELFNKEELRQFIDQQTKNTNNTLENIIHNYVSHIVSKAMHDFLKENIEDFEKIPSLLPQQETKIKIFKQVLKGEKIDIKVNPSQSFNNNPHNKDIGLRVRQFKRKRVKQKQLSEKNFQLAK